MSHLFAHLSLTSLSTLMNRPPGNTASGSWLQTLRQRRARRRLDGEQAALEACASEGAEVALRSVELDGQRYGALYRNGELICLLPQVQET
ncbi:hypothetical protein [Sphaerotilus sp.]|uniref:hypothetical protein n=1 Tax=Sphaerotilus sp. TaxID=2093942 RepID=UPI0034E2D180